LRLSLIAQAIRGCGQIAINDSVRVSG